MKISLTQKTVLLVIISLTNFKSFSQDFSVNTSHQLLFSKSIEESQKLLTENGFEANGTSMSKNPKDKSFIEYSFLKKPKNSKTKGEEIILWRQKDSENIITKFEYTTYNLNEYSIYKKDADQNFKKLGDKKNNSCIMVSYTGDKILETLQSCISTNISEYKIIVFNLLAAPTN